MSNKSGKASWSRGRALGPDSRPWKSRRKGIPGVGPAGAERWRGWGPGRPCRARGLFRVEGGLSQAGVRASAGPAWPGTGAVWALPPLGVHVSAERG